jgi:uncharacterized membrane protein
MSFVIVLIASVLFGVIPSIQKLVLLDGVSPLVLVLICNSFSAAFTLAVCLAAHKSLAVTKRQLLDLFWIGVSLFLTDWLLNLAYTLMPVGPTTMVHFLYPSLVCAAMAVFFGQRIRLRRAAGIVLSVLGLFLMAGSFSGSSRSGVAVAAMSAAAYAFYMIASEKNIGRPPRSRRTGIFHKCLFRRLRSAGCPVPSPLPARKNRSSCHRSELVLVSACRCDVLRRHGSAPYRHTPDRRRRCFLYQYAGACHEYAGQRVRCTGIRSRQQPLQAALP